MDDDEDNDVNNDKLSHYETVCMARVLASDLLASCTNVVSLCVTGTMDDDDDNDVNNDKLSHYETACMARVPASE